MSGDSRSRAVRRPRAPLRGHRRCRHERPRARREAARRERDRVRPGRVLVFGAAAGCRHRAAIGHDAANLPEGAEVVVSTAIPEDNPELAAAARGGPRVLHRADLLGELSRMKKTIAVSGTHGKTTTASMIALALLETGRDPVLPDRRRAARGRHERRLGRRRVGRDRGRRVRPLLPEAAPRRRRRDEHRAGPPRDVRVAWPSWRRPSPSSPAGGHGHSAPSPPCRHAADRSPDERGARARA